MAQPRRRAMSVVSLGSHGMLPQNLQHLKTMYSSSATAVCLVDQNAIKQLKLRIETDQILLPRKRKLKLTGQELESLPPEVFLLNDEIDVLDLSPEREACLYYQVRQVSKIMVVCTGHAEITVFLNRDKISIIELS